jgi:hypothetical protein
MTIKPDHARHSTPIDPGLRNGDESILHHRRAAGGFELARPLASKSAPRGARPHRVRACVELEH